MSFMKYVVGLASASHQVPNFGSFSASQKRFSKSTFEHSLQPTASRPEDLQRRYPRRVSQNITYFSEECKIDTRPGRGYVVESSIGFSIFFTFRVARRAGRRCHLLRRVRRRAPRLCSPCTEHATKLSHNANEDLILHDHQNELSILESYEAHAKRGTHPLVARRRRQSPRKRRCFRRASLGGGE